MAGRQTARAAVFAAALALSAGAGAQATIYKCAGEGSVLYTSVPCHGATLRTFDAATPRLVLAQATVGTDVPRSGTQVDPGVRDAAPATRDRPALEATIEAKTRRFRELDDARRTADANAGNSSVAWARSALHPWPPRSPATPSRTPDGREAQWMAEGGTSRLVR